MQWTVSLVVIAVFFLGGYLFGREDVDFHFIREWVDEVVAEFSQQAKEISINSKPSFKKDHANKNEIHIFDIGQGASTLLIDDEGTSILIDTGRHDDSSKMIISYLDEHIGLGNSIDLLIFTHNHSDHIGHGDLVLNHFDVQEVWLNGMDHTTKVYEKLLDTLLVSDTEYVEPKAGEEVALGNFKIDVLHPEQDSPKKDHNDESIVTRISFNGVSLMTSGDTSIPRENDIIERSPEKLSSDLLFLGHHGADNSSGEKWIEAVSPEIAFYQAGVDNIYGHPGIETLERLKEMDVPVYGTNEYGTISIYFDETSPIEIETEK